MEKDKIEQLFEEAKKTALTKNEEELGLHSLRNFIKGYPVRDMALMRHISQRSILTRLIKPMTIAITLLIVALVGGGSSFAAEESLPGDLLYSMKVGVNEQVRGWVAVGAEADAEWEARRAERRLEEAEALAVRGKLEGDAKARVENNFALHAEKTEELIAKLESENKISAAIDVSSRLESSLSAHGKVLARFSEASDISEEAQARANAAAQTRVLLEAKLSAGASADVEAAARGRLKTAQNKVAEVRASFERNRASMSASAAAEIEAELNAAVGIIAGGEAQLEAGGYQEAFVEFDRAHRAAQGVHILVTTSKELDIDIGTGGVNIELEGGSNAEGGGASGNMNSGVQAGGQTSGSVNAGGTN